jgi:hypothetical protein
MNPAPQRDPDFPEGFENLSLDAKRSWEEIQKAKRLEEDNLSLPQIPPVEKTRDINGEEVLSSEAEITKEIIKEPEEFARVTYPKIEEPIAEKIQEKTLDWKEGREWKEFEQRRLEKILAENQFKKKEITDENLFKNICADYENARDVMSGKIHQALMAEAPAGLTEEQRGELNVRIKILTFEELVEKEYVTYKKVSEELREKGQIEKTWDAGMEIAKKALNTKAMKWYMGLDWKTRIALSSAVITLGASVFGTFAATGALAFGVKRLGRGALSFGATTLAGGSVEKVWSAEEINKKREGKLCELKAEDLSLEQS